MNNQTLLIIFIAVVAAAFLLQSLALLGIYKSLRVVCARVDRLSSDVLKNMGVLTGQAEEVFGSIKVIAQKAQSLEESVVATTEMIQKRIADIDAFLQEATGAARLQILRIQEVVDTAARNVEDAFETLHHGVRVPVNEVSALVRGVKVGLDVLLHKRMRPTVQSRQDEEMFI